MEDAIQTKNVKKVKELLQSGYDINSTSLPDTDTALTYACRTGFEEGVKVLIEAGANVNQQDGEGYSPLYAAASEGYGNIVNYLLSKNPDINKNADGYTPLLIAASEGHSNIVKLLIDAGADVNIVTAEKGSPLYFAAYNKHRECVELLIEAGAELDIETTNNHTVLCIAVSDKLPDLNIIQVLINAGADVNKTNPILQSATNGNKYTMKVLVDAGANVNVKTSKGETALLIAARTNKVDLVRILIQAGADTNLCDNQGKCPLEVTTNDEIKKLIKSTLKWEGWTEGDASKLDGIFGDDAVAKNFSLCPVCMKYIIRSEACMYMYHNCKELKGYYHEDLYKKYKNDEGIIHWCTICGRICKGHRHFALGAAQGPSPALLPGRNPFDTDCVGEGGGSIPEKLLRFRRLREYAKELQDEVGKLSWIQAMDELCEEMWNAPLSRVSRTRLERMTAEKKFNISSSNFPIRLTGVEQNAPNIPYLLANNTEEQKREKLPILNPTETSTITNFMKIDDVDILQFQHKRKDGTINKHDNPGQQISRVAFIHWLKHIISNPSAEEFGYCWQYKTAAQLIPLSNNQRANVCNAILHPEEVKAALDMTDNEQASLAEGYRKAFNKVFDRRRL